jgi:hypothetical protein
MTVREAPIPRSIIDELLPWLRALLGLAFVVYCANSTIFIGGGDLVWLFPKTAEITLGFVRDALWYSSVVAIILFIGQVATSERYPRAYWLFLIPDVFYTVRGMWAGLCRAMIVLFGGKPGDGSYAELLGYIIGSILACVVGFYVAKWGEVLLFGKRRKPRKAAAA